MDVEAGAVAGVVLVVLTTTVVSGPAVGAIDLTRERSVVNLNPGSGTVSLSLVRVENRTVVQPGQFGSGAHYITPPKVTVDIQKVTEQPILTYRIQVPELSYTDIQVTFLGANNVGKMTIGPDRDSITLPDDPAGSYQGELVVVVRDSSGKRVVYREQITVEVRE